MDSDTTLNAPLLKPQARPTNAEEAYSRNVVTVFGLPFDVMDLRGAVATLRRAAFENRRCFVSTPNLNFAVQALRDEAFRISVLRSDLSLADGMPIVALAWADRLPLRDRVSGATVFEALVAHEGPPLNVYFFGGEPGTAEAASRRIETHGSGLRCVGHEDGGFGPVETLGDAGTVDRINDSGAHFVVASLGAAKGQAWLRRHAAALKAPLLCHLGAVLNFAAGRIRRAPLWMQRAGLEWAWRVREEPQLWRRYAGDAAAAARCLIPRLADRRINRTTGALPTVETESLQGGPMVRLGGDWGGADLGPLRLALAEVDGMAGPMVIDLQTATSMDSASIALLQVAEGRRGAAGFWIRGASGNVVAAFRRCVADAMLR